MELMFWIDNCEKNTAYIIGMQQILRSTKTEKNDKYVCLLMQCTEQFFVNQFFSIVELQHLKVVNRDLQLR